MPPNIVIMYEQESGEDGIYPGDFLAMQLPNSYKYTYIIYLYYYFIMLFTGTIYSGFLYRYHAYNNDPAIAIAYIVVCKTVTQDCRNHATDDKPISCVYVASQT